MSEFVETCVCRVNCFGAINSIDSAIGVGHRIVEGGFNLMLNLLSSAVGPLQTDNWRSLASP